MTSQHSGHSLDGNRINPEYLAPMRKRVYSLQPAEDPELPKLVMERWIATAAVCALIVGLVECEDRKIRPEPVSTTPTTTTTNAGPHLPYGKYLIMYPKSMRAGQSLFITVQVFDLVKKFDVRANLAQSGSSSPTIDAKEIQFEKGTHTSIIELEVPTTLDATSFKITMDGASKEDDGHPVADGLSFEDEKSIRLERKGVSVFIQTDKAIYKPSQTVQFRAMAVYPDLKPYLGTLDIDLVDAEGNKIKQYKDLQNRGHNGVISKELQLSDQPILGDWKINVKALETLQTKTFTVAEYVLPKFEVTVDAPSYFYYMDSVLTINIGAKYTYGKKVKGVADIVVQLKYLEHELAKRQPLQHKLTVRNFNGSTILRMTRDELMELVLPPSGSYTRDPVDIFKYKTILVLANVTEGVSGVTLSGKADIAVKTQRHELKFLSGTPSSFKPGLTYVGFVKLSQMDGTPPLPSDLLKKNGQAEMVQIVFTGKVGTRWPYKYEKLNESFQIQPSGLVRFSIDVPNNFSSIEMLAAFRFVKTSKSVKKFKSKSDVGIQVSLVGLENGGAVKRNTPKQGTLKFYSLQ
ncbi:hypothetical protein LSAT2_027943 [Lamellibrachia satsuma]|nr:hypothetical protein LSAT2_027943 [Lamellibrachia satsuma]